MTLDPKSDGFDKANGLGQPPAGANRVSMAVAARNELCDLIDLLLEEQLDAAGRARLLEMLAVSEEAQSVYIAEMNRHAGLAWEWGVFANEGIESDDNNSDFAFATDDVDTVVESIDLGFMPHISYSLPPVSANFVGGPVFSYMVATVVLCVMLLSAWAYKVTHNDNQIVNEPKSVPTSVDPRYELVAQITGMKDCRWTEQSQENYVVSGLSLGREINLAAGLLEITYKTGAKVILEGPCSYKVDSLAGGFLRQGKLVARVEKKVASDQWLVARKKGRVESGGWRGNKEVSGDNKPEDAGRGLQSESLATSHQPLATISQSPAPSPESPTSPLSTLHSPLFTISTPTAVITDLGTEFGVEVAENGDTVSCVFQGSIKVQTTEGLVGSTASSDAPQETVLRVNESARVVRDVAGPRLIVGNEAGTIPRFVQKMPDPSLSSDRTFAIDGRVFQDDFNDDSIDAEKWSINIRQSGNISVADGLATIHSDALLPEGTAALQSVALDFSDSPDDWWVEIRFKMDGALTSGGFQLVRDWIVLAGVSQPTGKWEIQGIDIRAMQRGGVDSETFDLGWWGWDNTNNTRIPVALARALDKGRFYNLAIHRKSDGAVDIYLDGHLIDGKPLILGRNPTLLRCGDTSIYTGGTQVIDCVKVGEPVENKSTSQDET